MAQSDVLPERPPATVVRGKVGREAIKSVVRGMATAAVLPLLLVWWVESRFIGRDRALEYATELLAIYPGLVGRYLRRAFLARVLVRCHPTAEIGFGAIFSKADAVIDENVYVGPRCHIGLAHLERDVLLAAGVHVTSGARTHGTADLIRPVREQEGVRTLVRVGAGAWVGSAAVVMADVGAGTVVGAGAVVSTPLPDNVVAAGVPARVLHSREGAGPAR
jgi:acetyltransferase-like isoleucine patch superfamily enzyme